MSAYDGIRTSGDLYEWVRDLAESRRGDDVTLEAYLRALLGSAEKHVDASALPLGEFLDLLGEAFKASAPPFNEAWRCAIGPKDIDSETITYAEWRAQLQAQIADLRAMNERGALDDERRYLNGVDAPSGVRWYNFDPCTYLECAAAGCFSDAKEDVGADRVSWRTFVLFRWCGSSYE